MISLALYGGGWLRSGFFPSITSDYVKAEITCPRAGPSPIPWKSPAAGRNRRAAGQGRVQRRPGAHQGLGPVGHVDSRGRENEIRVDVTVEVLSDKVDTAEFI